MLNWLVNFLSYFSMTTTLAHISSSISPSASLVKTSSTWSCSIDSFLWAKTFEKSRVREKEKRAPKMNPCPPTVLLPQPIGSLSHHHACLLLFTFSAFFSLLCTTSSFSISYLAPSLKKRAISGFSLGLWSPKMEDAGNSLLGHPRLYLPREKFCHCIRPFSVPNSWWANYYIESNNEKKTLVVLNSNQSPKIIALCCL